MKLTLTLPTYQVGDLNGTQKRYIDIETYTHPETKQEHVRITEHPLESEEVFEAKLKQAYTTYKDTTHCGFESLRHLLKTYLIQDVNDSDKWFKPTAVFLQEQYEHFSYCEYECRPGLGRMIQLYRLQVKDEDNKPIPMSLDGEPWEPIRLGSENIPHMISIVKDIRDHHVQHFRHASTSLRVEPTVETPKHFKIQQMSIKAIKACDETLERLDAYLFYDFFIELGDTADLDTEKVQYNIQR